MILVCCYELLSSEEFLFFNAAYVLLKVVVAKVVLRIQVGVCQFTCTAGVRGIKTSSSFLSRFNPQSNSAG